MHRGLSLALLLALAVILIGALPGWAGEEAPAPAAPAAAQPAPTTPAPEQPAPTTPAPEQPAPSTPAPEQPAPAPTQPAPAAPAPAPETPVTPAPAPATPTPAPAAPEAPQNIITSIQVVGQVHIPEATIRAAIASKVGQVYSEEQVAKDRTAIVELGWFETVSVERAVTETGIALTFRVVENPVVNDIRFDGNTVLSREQLLAVMQTKPGQVFSSRLLAQDSRAIENLYHSQGYILALVLGRSMSPEGVLTIAIVEGVIEAIRITGNTRTKDKVVHHYIRTKPGDVYNDRKVAADVNRLAATRFFDSVQRTAEASSSEPGKVVLVITVVERKRTGQATVGGGYSSVQGIVGFVDLTKENLRGTGQAVTVRAEGGGRSSYEFYYRNPWVMTPETRLNLGIYNRLVVREAFVRPEAEPGVTRRLLYDERRTGGSLTFGRPLSDRTIVYLGARSDRVSISASSAADQEFLKGPAFEPRDVRSITTALANDSRDNRDYPRRGAFHQASAEFAGLLGGSSDFHKYSLDSRRYFPLGGKNTVAFRLLVGTITGDAPYLEQFLIGGTESLRGFRTDRFVGTHLALLNTEYRIPMGKNLIGVAFVDVGDAWGGPIAGQALIGGDTSLTTHVGYGVGVRVATPIGPLRLDLGFSSEGTETHFGISQMF